MEKFSNICEGIFDDQDEKVAIKSINSPFWRMLSPSLPLPANKMFDISKTWVENGIIRLVPLLNKTIFLPQPNIIPGAVPFCKGIDFGAQTNVAGDRNRSNWDINRTNTGGYLRCGLLTGEIFEIKDVTLDLTLESRVVMRCTNTENIENVDIICPMGKAVDTKIVFDRLFQLPTVHKLFIANSKNILFSGASILADAPILNKLFDWNSTVFYDAQGSPIKPKNFKKIHAIHNNLSKYNPIHNFESTYKIANVTLKDIDLDIQGPQLIVLKSNTVIMYIFKPDRILCRNVAMQMVAKHVTDMKLYNQVLNRVINDLLNNEDKHTRDGWVVAMCKNFH